MTSSPEPLAAMYRANQVFHEQGLETHALSCGVACLSREFPTVGNQFREVTLVGNSTAADAYDEVQAFYAQSGRTCVRWVPALHQPAEPLEAFLKAKGFLPSCRTVMALQRWPDLPAHPDVRILPGRAMRQALRQLILDDAGLGNTLQREFAAHVMITAMDNPAFDMILAMVDGRAVGHGAVLQVGPVAAIYGLYVRDTFRGRGIARAMMTHLLTQCRRLDLRTVVLEVDEGNATAIGLYGQCGFARAGASVEFRMTRNVAVAGG